MMVKMTRGSHSSAEFISQTCVPLTASTCRCSELGDQRWDASEHLVKLRQLELASSQSDPESGVSSQVKQGCRQRSSMCCSLETLGSVQGPGRQWNG